MNVDRWVQIPEEFPARLRWAGRLLAAGLLIELPTLFWPHTVSFFLFLGGGAMLAGAGMALYLYSVVTLKGLFRVFSGRGPYRVLRSGSRWR